MKKIVAWFKRHLPTKRKLIQLYAALLFNANLKGFGNGKIYTGPMKNICAPGMNCYSSPAPRVPVRWAHCRTLLPPR